MWSRCRILFALLGELNYLDLSHTYRMMLSDVYTLLDHLPGPLQYLNISVSNSVIVTRNSFNFSELASHMQDPTHLRVLDISGNGFTDLHGNLCPHFPELTYLDVSSNRILTPTITAGPTTA